MNDIWKTYYENTKNQPPRPLLVKAIPFVKEKGIALDLGAGALNDSIFLLKEGFAKVFAIDKEAVATEIAGNLPADKFNYIISNFEDYDFPKNRFDLINAQYSLPFMSPDKFVETFNRITESLKPEGIFVGQLFGEKDGWCNNKNMTFQKRQEVEKLLSIFSILSLDEEETDKPTASQEMKHWHIFHFIVRK